MEQQLTPITPARLAQEISTISRARKAGELTSVEFEHRFARMVGELRERRIDGTRSEILQALTPLVSDGTITPDDWSRLIQQLGLD
jgi:hypothetical protein